MLMYGGGMVLWVPWCFGEMVLMGWRRDADERCVWIVGF